MHLREALIALGHIGRILAVEEVKVECLFVFKANVKGSVKPLTYPEAIKGINSVHQCLTFFLALLSTL